jgi:hypothetical protein
LNALDGEQLARIIDLQLGVAHGAWIRPRMAQSQVWPLSLSKRPGSVWQHAQHARQAGSRC